MKVISPGGIPAQDDAVRVLDEIAIVQLTRQQRLFGAPALGDVVGQNEFGRSAPIGERVRNEFHIDQRAVLRQMPPEAGVVDPLVHGDDVLQQQRNVLARPDVHDRHAQELVARVPVASDGGVVDGQESQSLQVVHPHRVRIAVEKKR
jgi:hypothetical protein